MEPEGSLRTNRENRRKIIQLMSSQMDAKEIIYRV
jgi:hypothetical protein